MDEEYNNWDLRFFNLAYVISNWSKDPNCKVGAVLISPDKTKISYGYNGFPRNIADNERINSDDKNTLTIHAELNAILNAKADIKDWTLYSNKFPCIECAKAIIQSNLKRIVVKARSESKWKESQDKAYNLLKEANIYITEV